MLGRPFLQDRSGGVGKVARTKTGLAAYGGRGLHLVGRRVGTVTTAELRLRMIGTDDLTSLITTDRALDGGTPLFVILQRTATGATGSGLLTRTARRGRSTVGIVGMIPSFSLQSRNEAAQHQSLENPIRRRRRDPDGFQSFRGSATDSPHRRNVSNHSRASIANGGTSPPETKGVPATDASGDNIIRYVI